MLLFFPGRYNVPNAKIFFRDDNTKKLTPLKETPYEKEDILQELLADHDDLLPGDQIDPDDPRRWLLVTREMGVPGEQDGGGRWSLDHLFLDQDSMPTFVECKRASDTRGRREVVAQMLDYAANGTKHWSIGRLREAAEKTAEEQGKDLKQEILRLIQKDDDSEIDRFWKQVEENLKTGHVRLIFVADKIPSELARLVEFLNEKMTDVHVLAVEVKQFVGQGGKVLVPRLLGLTEAARIAKSSGAPAKRAMNRDEFLEKCSGPVGSFLTQLLERAEQRGFLVGWPGTGFTVRTKVTARPLTFLYGWPSGEIRFSSEYLLSAGILSREQEPEFRRKLLSLSLFEPIGKSSFRTTADAETLPSLPKVFEAVFDMVDELLKPLVPTTAHALA
jgi:hypothetical protein